MPLVATVIGGESAAGQVDPDLVGEYSNRRGTRTGLSM
jgi:hypothetical protein